MNNRSTTYWAGSQLPQPGAGSHQPACPAGSQRRALAAGAHIAVAAAAAGLALAHAAPGITAVGPLRRMAFTRLAGQGAAGHLALSFDDGPDPVWTPRFLDLLAARSVQATFFLLGKMVARAPALVAEIVAAGHEVGVHGWDHPQLLLRGPGATRDDIVRATDAIAAAAGRPPRLYRPPYGVLTTAALLAARRLGLSAVLWTCCGREWARGATAGSVLSALTSGELSGATVLLHDSDAVTPGMPRLVLQALPQLLDECTARGLAVGTVAEHRIGR